MEDKEYFGVTDNSPLPKYFLSDDVIDDLKHEWGLTHFEFSQQY